MALTKLPGFTIDSNTNVAFSSANITNTVTSATVSAGNILTDNLKYANGAAWSFGTGTPSGSNTQLQFNDNDAFGGSANLTFNKTTGVLSVNGNVVATYLSGNGSTLTSLTGANVTGTVANATYSNISGTVSINAQPNITSVGTLSSLNVTGNVSANYFVGNGSLLTGIATGTNYANSNVASYLPTYTGNLAASNANLGNLVTANYFTGSGNNLSNIQGANVTGTVANATYAVTAGTSNSVAVANVSGIGNIATINLNGNGSQVLAGNGAWITQSSGGSSNISNGTSNVNIPSSNGNINLTSAGNTTLVVTGTGANVNGTLSVTGVSELGNVGNVKITGGSANYVLSTDGTGNLSWAAQSSGTNSTIAVDSFTGNGVQIAFTLSSTPASANYVIVNIDGVSQLHDAFTVANANVTFDSAPSNGAIIEVTTFSLGTSGSGGSGGTASVNVPASGVFYENDQTVTANYTITSGKSAMCAGPITINNGVTVTIPTGSRWVIL